MPSIRSAARALIFRGEKILLTRCQRDGHEFYLLPGGGQQLGETLEETVVRECREEIGVEVEVIRLRFVRDYIPASDAFSYLTSSETTHQVEHFFECRVPESDELLGGSEPDPNQLAVEWLDAAALSAARVYPEGLARVLDPQRSASLPVYWADSGRSPAGS